MVSIRAFVRGALAAQITLVLAAGALLADASGRTGRTGTGCTCHGSLPSPGVTVTITGPQLVAPLSTHDYTVSVSGGPAGSSGGFDLKASAGTLVAGTNNRISGSEVTHSNRNSRSWTFSWTAPALAGSQSFVAVGLGCDASGGTGGDSWNYYGGAANTAFAIDVSDALGVAGMPGTTWLAPPVPNPCRGEAQIEFALAVTGPVRMDVIDLSGRRIATLLRETRPAGRQSVRWDRRGDDGTRAAAGVYFVRLANATQKFTTRLLVVD